MIVPPLLAYLGQTASTVGQGLVTNRLQNQIENLLPQRNEDFEKLLEDSLNTAIEQLRAKYSSPVHTAIFTCIKATGKDFIFSDQSVGLRNAILFGDPAQIGQLFAALFGPCIAKHLPERSDGLFDNLAVKFVECFDTLLKTEKHEKGWKAFHRDLERAVLKATAGEIALKTASYEILVEINSKLDEQLSFSTPPDPPDYSAYIRLALSQFFEGLNESVQALSNRVEELTQEIKERNRQEGFLKEEQKNTAYFRERTIALEAELESTKCQLREALALLAERQSAPRDQEALQLESEGNIEEAKSIWDDQEEAYARKAEQDLLKRAQNRLQRFHFLLRNHDWQAAEQDLLWGLGHAPSSMLNNFLDAGVDWTSYMHHWANFELALNTAHKLVESAELESGASPDLAPHLNSLGSLLYAINRLDEAEPFVKRALEIDEKSYGPNHPDVAVDLNNLAQLLYATNRLAEAEPLMKRALEIFEISSGSEHPNVATQLNNLAQLLYATNRLAEAEPLMIRALEIHEKSFGPNHPDVATDLNNLALLLQDTNRLAEAEPLMRRALDIDERSYGPNHPNVARDLSNLALLLRDTNRLAEAEPLTRRALDIDERSYGPNHPNVAIRLNNLALLLQDTNRLAEAEPLMRRALDIDEKGYGPNHPNVAIRHNNLASLLYSNNRLAEAEPLMKRALDIDEMSFGPNHPNVAEDLNNLAQLLCATNRFAEAELLMKRALEIDEKSYGPNHPNVARDLSNIAWLLQDTNRLAEVEPLIKRALEIDEKSYGPNHPKVAIRLNNLASLFGATNRLTETEPLAKRSLRIFYCFQIKNGHPHPHFEAALINYASILKDLNYTDERIIQTLDDLFQTPCD